MKKQCSDPLISVVVPIYNVQKYVRKCIDSIIGQTYHNLEIILVDDGSTDCSPRICDEYSKRDTRIKVIHKINEGLVSARKAGVRVAIGDYIAYVDGDDWIEQNMYEQLIHKINGADVVICGVARDYGKHVSHEVNKVKAGLYEGKELVEKIFKKMIYSGVFFERGIQPHVYNVLFRADLLRHNQLQVSNDIRVGEDAACLYPTLLDAKKVCVTSECFYHYQMRDNSIMGVNDKMELERYKILYNYLKMRFCEKEELKENLICQLDYFMLFMLMLKEIRILQDGTDHFPYKGVIRNNKIVIYGAGRFGCEIVDYLNDQDEYSVVLWIDRNARGNVKEIEEIKKVSFDFILIAVLMKEMVEEIANYIIKLGIPEAKIKTIDMEQIVKTKEKVEKLLRLC